MARNKGTRNAGGEPEDESVRGEGDEYGEGGGFDIHPEADTDPIHSETLGDPNDYDGPSLLSHEEVLAASEDRVNGDLPTEPQDESQEPTRGRRGRRVRTPEIADIPTGRPAGGAELPPALATAWGDALNRSEETGKTFVPVLAINVDLSVLPRETLDEDAVDRYGDRLDSLPPIKVQKDTLTLIGGRHRLAGAGKAMRDIVEVEELDVPDRDLFMLATLDNVQHGIPLTPTERMNAARRIFTERPDLGKVKIAEITGISRVTLWRWEREEAEGGKEVQDGWTEGKVNDFLSKVEKFTAGSATEEALRVPTDQVFGRLTRVGAVVEWFSAYQDALRQRVEATEPVAAL